MMLNLEISEVTSFEFAEACAMGNVDLIRHAVHTGHNCNGYLYFKHKLYTPLMIAYIFKNKQSAQCLTELGAIPISSKRLDYQQNVEILDLFLKPDQLKYCCIAMK